VAQSAFNSFFRGVHKRRFPELNDRRDLWKLLVVITARKAAARRRYEGRKKRFARRVRVESLDTVTDDHTYIDRCFVTDQVESREPNPEFAVEVAEQCGQLFDRLNDLVLQRVALAKMEGYTLDEIASQIGVTRRTVQRKLDRIASIWSEATER
jgi:DNA-directed RNA polymerase specialized sigma24 family protein